jgi:hypothetical protein
MKHFIEGAIFSEKKGAEAVLGEAINFGSKNSFGSFEGALPNTHLIYQNLAISDPHVKYISRASVNNMPFYWGHMCAGQLIWHPNRKTATGPISCCTFPSSPPVSPILTVNV